LAITHTEADFDRLSWHDCHIYALAFRVGDVDAADWTSDLVLDIDFIVEWLCGVDSRAQFRVAPATLTFHGVTDLKIAIDWGNSGFQNALREVSIDGIQRQVIQGQTVYLDRAYYAWCIQMNWPAGEIRFGAVGFTQTLRAEPVLTHTQRVSLSQRPSTIDL
jgi:hypothetical protein